MEWTETHGRLLGQAFAQVLGRGEPGTVAFVRCLTPDVVARLATDDGFGPEGWDILRVANTDDAAARTCTADGAVERREAKGPATLLLVDTDRAGAGMDGIYSAAREVDEASLFRVAERLAGSEVTRQRSRPDREYAERAIRKAAGFGGRYSVPPWMRFDFLCRIAAHRRHPGAYAHLLGLWPVDESAEGDTAAQLDTSRRFVDYLLGPAAAGLTIPARIESLRLAEPTPEQRRELDRFLHEAEAQPLLPALGRLASRPQLWIGPLCIGGATEIRRVDLVPWRSTSGKVLKWSGLAEPRDPEDGPPVLILKSGDVADSGDYSKLEVRWRAQPAGLEKNSADYRVVISTDLDEELAAREVRHSAKGVEKCRFSDDDFSALDEDSVVSAKVVVSVVGNDAIQSEASEDFVIRFGEQEDPVQGGVGRTVRTFSEGLIELGDRERVSDVASGVSGTVVGSRGFVTLRQTEGQRSKSFRVVRPNLINEVESQWVGRSGSVGRWRVKVRAAGERVGSPEFVPFDGVEGTHFDRVIKASRDMAKRFSVVGGDGGGGGVAAVYDEQSKAGEAAREYVLAWTALLDGSDPSVALCNTVEVQSLAGQTIGIVVLPAHPLRVAWHAAYDNLVLHTAFVEQEKAKIVRDECGILDGALFPAFLPNPAGGAFVFADMLGFHAVGMVPDGDPEPKAAVALLARALRGGNEGDSAEMTATVGAQSATVLGDEIVKYLDCHDTSILLQVHALRAGDGLTISRALGRVHKRFFAPDDDETRPSGSAEQRMHETVHAPIFSLDLYPSAAQRGVAGRFIAAAREKRRSGAGVVSQEDRWMLESLSLPGGVNLPRLRWARKPTEEPQTAAHLAVAFDTFASRVVAEERESPATRPFHAFGLLSFFEREYGGEPSPVWRSTIPFAREGEKHPSERGHTERLVRLDRALRYAVARHLAPGEGHPGGGESWFRWRLPGARQPDTRDAYPVLRTEVSPDKELSLRALHGLCDWVITLDRNAGVEYFDSPRDNKSIYDAYVIDCVPEREDLGCLQLITSTSNLDEVRSLLDRALDQMGLSHSRRNAEFLLEQLKALSGRLAIRLTGSKPPTSELIAFALAHASCRTATAGDDCWTPLEDGFVIPVDDIRDLLPCLRDAEFDDGDAAGGVDARGSVPSRPEGDGRRFWTGARPDLIHVSTIPRKGLVWRFIEVKYRRDLRAARAPDVLRRIDEQVRSLRARWQDWFAADVCSPIRAIRRARLARVLRFYADKARRHYLSAEKHAECIAEIDRMIERGGDYRLAQMAAGDRGWVFCPEYTGRDPQRISPDGWTVPTFLFGPARLPDAGGDRQTAVVTVAPVGHGDVNSSGVEGDRSDGATAVLKAGSARGSGESVSDAKRVVSVATGGDAVSGRPPSEAKPDLTERVDGGRKEGADEPSQVADSEGGATRSPSIDLGVDNYSGAAVRWSLTIRGNPHLLVAGLPGMGKTTCLLNLCRQMVAAGVYPIIFSYHQDIDERLVELMDPVRFIDCDGLGFNPLMVTDREAPRAYLDVAGSLRDIFAAIFPDLGDLQCESIRRAIKESFVEEGWSESTTSVPEPEFGRFVEILRADPKPDRGMRTLLARLTELEDYGFFDIGKARGSLWTSDRPIVIRIHTTQNDALQRAFASLVFYGLYKDMFRRGIQDRITHALIFDEAHRAAGLKLIPTMAKECRKYGISLVLASQEAKDFHASLFSAVANYLVLRLTEADAKALVRNVATAREERTLIDRIKQMARFRALYFCEGKQRPAAVSLKSLD